MPCRHFWRALPAHFALLMVLEHFSPRPRQDVGGGLPGPESVTSRRGSWGPRQRNIQPGRIMETVVERAKDDATRKKKATTCSLYEARSPAVRVLGTEAILRLRSLLNVNSRFCSILPASAEEVSYVQTKYDMAPLGSVLSYQLCVSKDDLSQQVAAQQQRRARKRRAAEQQQAFKESLTTPHALYCEYHPPSPQTLAKYQRRKAEGYDLPDEDYQRWLQSENKDTRRGREAPSASCFPVLPLQRQLLPGGPLPKQPISLAAAQAVEEQTRGQARNPTWHRYHSFVITASNFKLVCRRKNLNSAFFDDLFSSKDLSHVEAVRHGIEHEKQAAVHYCGYQQQQGREINLKTCGLCLDTDYSYLGVSPDRIVSQRKTHHLALLRSNAPTKRFHRVPLSARCCAAKIFALLFQRKAIRS